MATRSKAASASAASSSASDMVTIIYPAGCREVSDELGNDELIRRLKTLAHTFQMLNQAEDESTYAEYVPLAIHLADEHFLSHQSKDVQLLVACCVADILRIFAPEAPYKDPAQIKTLFYFLIKQLGGLKDPKDPAFKRYFYLLENLAYVKSFNMCFDLEECSEIICALYQLIFKIVNDEHSGKVKTFMLEVLSPLIAEADFVSNELLDIVLVHIVEPLKSQKKNAYSLAKDLVAKTGSTLEPYIQQFFNQVLILGKADNSLQISRKVYDLIYELNLISPRILLTVLPQLEFKLKSTDEAERMGSVSLLARMFSEKGSSLARDHRALWLAFLGRYNDISVAIRIKCVQYTMHFLLNHPELVDDVTETLKLRQHDSDENVRYEVVMAIVATAKKSFEVVSQSEQLLTFVKERTLDKKFKIRKEAVSGLAQVYKHYLGSDPAAVPEATAKAITWIKDKILHGYYMPGMEDRLLVERLINTCLVPFSLESKDRMRKLLLLYATIDDNASKAFIEVQKSQFLVVRKAVDELVQLHRRPRTDERDKEIQQAIVQCAKNLPESVRATEYLRKFSKHMLDDRHVLDLMEKIVDPEGSCQDCMKHVNLLLKKLGAPIMTNLYYRTIKSLLERVSSVMVDGQAVEDLVCIVRSALEGDGNVLEELGLDQRRAGERGLKLILLLAFVFPQHFLRENVIRTLIFYLSIKGDNTAPLALSALSFVGKHKPLGDAFPELASTLVPICKQFIARGNEKQAKQAVKCLFNNTTTTQEAVFADILETVKGNLDPEKGESYKTAIVALGHVAFHLPDKFPIMIKNLVSRKIVKELLMQDKGEERRGDDEDDPAWEECDELPLETQCKIEGLKMMARWLVGLRDDREDDVHNGVTLSAQKTFRMLAAIVSNKGDLLEEGRPSPAERAHFRLAAGCAMLKICEQKGVGDRYTLEQFYTLASLFVDPVPQVREKILAKLHKGLSRSLANRCLPLDFMGLFALCGLEQDKRIAARARNYMTFNINKRRDYVKGIMLTGGAGTVDKVHEQLDRILPDYMLVFAVPILANLPDFQRVDDVDVLKRLQSGLWFIMEPLMTKNDNFSFSFYKALLEKMKSMKDKRRPDDELANQKMWTVCDLALALLITKTTNYELREFPAGVRMPPMFYAEPDDPNFINQASYLPREMVPKNPKKAGLVGHLLAGSGAANAQKRRQQQQQSEVPTVVVTGSDAAASASTGDRQVVVEVVQEDAAEEEEEGAKKGRGKRAAAKKEENGDGAASPPPPKRGRQAAAAAAAATKEQAKAPEPEASTSSGRPRRAATRK